MGELSLGSNEIKRAVSGFLQDIGPEFVARDEELRAAARSVSAELNDAEAQRAADELVRGVGGLHDVDAREAQGLAIRSLMDIRESRKE